MLVELGKLTKLVYRDVASGRRRVIALGLRDAPILAYDPTKRVANLVIVYATRVVGRASAAAIREYSRTHWGAEGQGQRVAGDVALEPLTELGPGLSIAYTTRKGADRDLVDWDHEWGKGASGKFIVPAVKEHRCAVPRCATKGRLALAGGTYRVTDRGIVG